MAIGKKTGGRDIQKGQVLNPSGRAKVPEDIKALRKAATFEVQRVFNKYLFADKLTVESAASDNRLPMLESITAKILNKAHEQGDYWKLEFILNRLIGSPMPPEPIDVIDTTPLKITSKKSFSEFCKAADYPDPFEKQVEMMAFGMTREKPRLILGSRGYGKTDYVVILGIAYTLYLNPERTFLIMTKSKERNSSILNEIYTACIKNGMTFEKVNSNYIRVAGHQGKDQSVSAVTVKTVSLRGRHPDMIVMDDPVTEDDTSEATRALIEKKYNELFKLSPNILIIGQPAHKFDLYAKIRGVIDTMEVPHGTIPELDHDLQLQRLAGIDEASIQKSYFLSIPKEGSTPFDLINYLEEYPEGHSIAFIDPSHEGGDFTAITILRGYMGGVAVVGFAIQKSWNNCLEDFAEYIVKYKVQKLAFETNGLGQQPLEVLRQAYAGIGIVGIRSNTNKHSRIMAAGTYAHLIHLSRESNKAYTDQVVKYEFKAKNDDAPDSLASCMQWAGLIKGKE